MKFSKLTFSDSVPSRISKVSSEIKEFGGVEHSHPVVLLWVGITGIVQTQLDGGDGTVPNHLKTKATGSKGVMEQFPIT